MYSIKIGARSLFLYNYAKSPNPKTFMKYALCCVTMICASLAKLCTAYSYSAFCYDTVPISTEVEVLHSPIARAGEMRERTGIICSKLYLCIESIGHALHIIIHIHV